MKTLAALVIAACLLGNASAARAVSPTLILDTDLGAVHESNIGLAQRNHDIKSDTALSTSVSSGAALQLDDRTLVSVTGDLSLLVWERFRGLSSLSAGLTPAFRHKLGLGAAAPWVRLWSSGARLDYDNDVRDSWRVRVGADVGKRFAERWDVRAGYAFEERIADHGRAISRRLPGNVFDLTSHTYALRTDFLASDAISLFAGYAFRDGDVVATTRPNPKIIAASRALTRDPAFGAGFVAYRIAATTQILSVGLSFALSPRSSLNASFEHHIGQAQGGNNYLNEVFRAGFLFSY